MAGKSPTSVVHVCGDTTNGSIMLEKGLLGSKVSNLIGGRKQLLALSEDGVFDIIAGKKLDISVVNSLAVGKDHCVALLPTGQLYSWGVGSFGELGLGPKAVETSAPTKIEGDPHFVQISCGDNHSAAVDNKGNAYAWGRNFNYQLGLYNKEKSKMIYRDRCYIEDMMFVPKFLPFCIGRSIVKMSCGSNFSMAITKSGELWSWGGGDCGQLGTGRCTHKEVPSCCYPLAVETDTSRQGNLPDAAKRGGGGGRAPSAPAVPAPLKKQESAIINKEVAALCNDVVCGSGHVLMLTNDGEVYSWGLNSKGQLGLGDIKTRHKVTVLPTNVFNTSDTNASPTNRSKDLIVIKRIFADMYSSAAIDSQGRLFTWGSGAHFKTMHFADASVLTVPSLVGGALRGNIVQTFAFSETQSAALVATKLLKINPEFGPLKSFQNLALYGCGFWPSDDIVVKFSRVGSAFVPPRSTLGRFIPIAQRAKALANLPSPDADFDQGDDDQGAALICCRPPKFSEEGEYDVAVAVNGVDFAPEVKRIRIYLEPLLTQMSPLLVDSRSVTDYVEVVLKGSYLTPAHRSDVFVMFSMTVVGAGDNQCNFATSNVASQDNRKKSATVTQTAVNSNTIKIVVMGTVEQAAVVEISRDEYSDEDDEDEDNESGFDGAEGGRSKASLHQQQEDDVKVQTITCRIPVDMLNMSDGVSIANSLRLLQVQVSLNGQDYCPTLADPLVVHAFEPSCVVVNPSTAAVAEEMKEEDSSVYCCPMQLARPRMIQISGSSFIPSNLVTTEAVVQLESITTSAGLLNIPAEILSMATRVVSVSCTSSTLLSMKLPNLQDILADAISAAVTNAVANLGENSASTPQTGRSAGSTSAKGSKKGRGSAGGREVHSVSPAPSEDDATFTNPFTSPDSFGFASLSISFRIVGGEDESAMEGLPGQQSISTASFTSAFNKGPNNLDVGMKDSALTTFAPRPILLTDNKLPVNLYKSAPITVSPSIIRSRVVQGAGESVELLDDDDIEPVEIIEYQTLTVSSGGFLFPVRNPQVSFVIPKLPHDKLMLDGEMVETEDPAVFHVTVPFPTPHTKKLVKGLSEHECVGREDDSMTVAVVLDRMCVPDVVEHFKIPVFHGLKKIQMNPLKAAAAAVPEKGAKGKAAAGADGGVVAHGHSAKVYAEGLVPSTNCMVRLRGNHHKNCLEVAGKFEIVEETEEKHIEFHVPSDASSLEALEPVLKGKDKTYFVDISLDDGVVYDCSEGPILQIK